MSIKKTTETTSSKILNSDIYELTEFVDDIKKRNIDGLGTDDGEAKETLLLGIYGYLGYQFTSLLQNAIVTASELSNEAIPTRAKFDRNVITHALSLGVEKVAGTPANMKVLMMFPETALRSNMVDGKFTFYAKTPLAFGDYEFHTDYDIEITYSDLRNSNNGSTRNYVYTAQYKMDYTNPISDIENPYLPPIAIYTYIEDNMVVLSTNLHQVSYEEIENKIVGTDEIANKTMSFTFTDQMAYFMISVEESDGTVVNLTPVYDGLYSQEQIDHKYCYYQYINSNTIRIRFDPSSYQPLTNATVKIKVYTTKGAEGNFSYTEDNTIKLTSDEYTNLYTIIAQRGEDGSIGGLDRQTVKELQHIIPKEALSRGSITTLTDLKNFFNSLNSETSVLHVFRKEDNILDRVYYTYNLMKDTENNIVPTNTIPIFVKAGEKKNGEEKVYIESGTPVYYYKYGTEATAHVLKDNYIGYLQQKIYTSSTSYSITDPTSAHTFYQGTPTEESLNTWYTKYKSALDPEDYFDIQYTTTKPETSYDFHKNASVLFSIKYIKFDSHTMDPDDSTAYDNKTFYGNISSSELKKYELNRSILKSLIWDGSEVIANSNIEITLIKNQMTYHIPARTGETSYFSVGGTITTLFGEDSKYITNITYYRPQIYNNDDEVIGYSDECKYELFLKYDYDDDGNIKNLNEAYGYEQFLHIVFRDESGKIFIGTSSTGTKTFIIPGYITNISDLSDIAVEDYIKCIHSFICPYVSDSMPMILKTIDTINCYSYDGQGDRSFSYLDSNTGLALGSNIRFNEYTGSSASSYVYSDPTTWQLAQVLSVQKSGGKIVSLELLLPDLEDGEFNTVRYYLPDPDDTSGESFSSDKRWITHIMPFNDFLYTCPLSIMLSDKYEINSHRVAASYYLDIIDETRYTDFKCINSKSPIQFILPYIHTYRTSYLSSDRYKYNISVELTPNTGTVDTNMINRTQVLAIFYKDGAPISYSIGKYRSVDNTESSEIDYDDDDNSIIFDIDLYSKPFGFTTVSDSTQIDIIDDDNNVYIGCNEIIKEIKEEYPIPTAGDDMIKAQQVWEMLKRYRIFQANSKYYRTNYGNEPQEDDYDTEEEYQTAYKAILDYFPNGIDDVISADKQGYYSSVYLNLNTEMRIFVLYKYDIQTPSIYIDEQTGVYQCVNNNSTDAMYNYISKDIEFPMNINITDPDDEGYIAPYKLGDMVLTNVYDIEDGINLLYDYSDIMNSYVTQLQTNDIFDPEASNILAYIVNRVPCVRYFYWCTEDRVLEFIKEMKRKINYVKDAIEPLECTFGLDFKFFNTYGPALMYHNMDDDGNVSDLINNVALTMTFRTKFYNDSDRDTIIPLIKDSIKDYLENLDDLADIHFPNLTTYIETEYSEFVVYFEFISYNIYDANDQHIITEEDMEMLKVVPEFLHVDTSDWDGSANIDIRVMS